MHMYERFSVRCDKRVGEKGSCRCRKLKLQSTELKRVWSLKCSVFRVYGVPWFRRLGYDCRRVDDLSEFIISP